MARARGRIGIVVLSLSLVLVFLASSVGRAESPANEHFARTWERTDKPVAELQTSRTWMWGPQGFTGQIEEPYVDAEGGSRKVQYFDKSRMEITSDANVSPESPWYVTNGLLVKELITGQLQAGNVAFEPHPSAEINVAGDPDDTLGPTYATFRHLLDEPALPNGASIIYRVDRAGGVSIDALMEDHGVNAAYRVTVDTIDHQIASPFWEFMNSAGLVWSGEQFGEALLFQDPFYATGYPITEAYWATVKVANEYADVLIQCFERRCLTYTPQNAPGWQVEAGNVGQHYYTWRYEQLRAHQPDLSPPSGSTPSSPAIVPTEPQVPTVGPFPTSTYVPTESPSNPAPTATAVETGESTFYVTDWDNRVVKFGSTGSYISEWGSKGSSQGRFNLPHGIAADPDGNVYVVDYGNHRVQKFDPNGNFLLEIGGEGAGNGKFSHPVAVAVDEVGAIFVADTGNALVQKFNSTGEFIRQWGGYGSGNGEFDAVGGIAVDSDGAVYVVDESANEVQKFDSDGSFLTKWGTFGDDDGEFDRPHSIAVSQDGDVYVGDIGNSRVQRFTSGGVFVGKWGQMGSELGGFHSPYGIAIDDRGDVYVLDYGHGRIQVFSPSGTYKRHWGGHDEGQARLQSPWGIALVANGTNNDSSDPPPPMATSTPSPSPSATPSPTKTPSVPPLSNAYLYPEGAVLAVWEELCECDLTSIHPGIELYIEKAYLFRHQYHLATAPVGSFNRDTTGFYDWLYEYFAGTLNRESLREHLLAQVSAAIYQPKSEVGIQIRTLEFRQDPLFAAFGGGPKVYWTYLVDPALGLWTNPLSYDAFAKAFDQHMLEYQASIASGAPTTPSFGDFLASIGYNMYGLIETR